MPIDNGELLTIWLNAWRYEREEHFAIIAPMKTIAYAMMVHPICEEIKPIIIRSLKIIAKGLVQGLAAKILGDKAIEDLRPCFLMIINHCTTQNAKAKFTLHF